MVHRVQLREAILNKKVFNEKFSLRGGGLRQMHVRFHWAIPEIK